jgi:hypothetical protein
MLTWSAVCARCDGDERGRRLPGPSGKVPPPRSAARPRDRRVTALPAPSYQQSLRERAEYVETRVPRVTLAPARGVCMHTYQLLLMTTPNVQSQSSWPARSPLCRSRYSASGSFLPTMFGTRTFPTAALWPAEALLTGSATARQNRTRQTDDDETRSLSFLGNEVARAPAPDRQALALARPDTP